MLVSERIITCDWTSDGGFLEYDLSYLHPDLGTLIQSYEVYTTDTQGRRIYASDFLLFPRNSAEEKDFGNYPKALKAQLWEIIFLVKRRFFEEIKPDVVTHFIDATHSIERRFALYSRWLFLPDYVITKTRQQIVYTRATPPDFGGGFLLWATIYFLFNAQPVAG